MSLKDKFLQKQNSLYCVFCLESYPLYSYFPFFLKKVCKVGVWFLYSHCMIYREAKVEIITPLPMQRLGKCFRKERRQENQQLNKGSFQKIFISFFLYVFNFPRLMCHLFLLGYHKPTGKCHRYSVTVSKFMYLILSVRRGAMLQEFCIISRDHIDYSFLKLWLVFLPCLVTCSSAIAHQPQHCLCVSIGLFSQPKQDQPSSRTRRA